MIESKAKEDRIAKKIEARLDFALMHEKVFDDGLPIPELVYHYTSFEGLVGILRDNSLRATFSESLNDSSERIHAQGIIEKAFDRSIETDKSLSISAGPTSMFVTCFCKDDDLLSMWRSYTQQAGGFALGFRLQPLHDLRADGLKNKFRPRLVPVHYGETLTEKMRFALNDPEQRSSVRWIMENAIKHEKFREEREWRLVLRDPPVKAMSFHSGHATVKASVSMTFENKKQKLPLKRLVYGPTLRKDKALEKTLHWLLDKYEYAGDEVEVIESKIPYRL